MGKKNIEKSSLDYEIDLANLERYVIDPQREAKEDLKTGVLKAVIVCLPLLIGFGVFLLTDWAVLLLIGTFITGGTAITKTVVDMIKDAKEAKRLANFNPKVTDINKELEPEELNLENVRIYRPEDFYTSEYRLQVEKEKYHSSKKENKKLEETRLTPVEEEKNLDKDEVKEEIVNSVNMYYKAYCLPPLRIKDNEWDIFFDLTYNIFIKNHVEDEFYERIYDLVKRTLARSLVYENHEVTIKDFVDNLRFLEGIDFSEKEIEDLKTKLNEALPGAKVIDFKTPTGNKRKAR